MNITLVSVGTLKEKYWSEALSEYLKRIGAYGKIEEYNIKEERIKNEESPAEVSSALENEASKILPKMTKDAYKVALCVEGKMLSSEELANVMKDAESTTGKLVFVIGSSHGLAPEVKRAADLCLSVSKMTFPHQMMRVMLSEMIYRALTINAGKSYHK